MSSTFTQVQVPDRAPLVPARAVPNSWLMAKRAIDLVVATTVLILTAPLMIAAMVGIVVTTGGSPIYRQERVGLNGKRFKLFKLRTMVPGAHKLLHDMRHLNEVDGPVFKMRDDPRVHVLGRVLRRTSIDELPNFINVLAGDMSVVGPRPPLPHEVGYYDISAMRRLLVKPGVTCLWQISGRSSLSFDEWVALDNRYIDTWSPAADLMIIAKTIPAVLRGDGAH